MESRKSITTRVPNRKRLKQTQRIDDDADSIDADPEEMSSQENLPFPIELSDDDEPISRVEAPRVSKQLSDDDLSAHKVVKPTAVSATTRTRNASAILDVTPGSIDPKTKCRRWCFTLNNPSSNELSLPDSVKYAIWSRERGANGTEHLQGYIRSNPISFKTAKAIFAGQAHVEPAKGSEQQNIDYCSKPESHIGGPWSIGTPANPGKRTDLQLAAAEILKTGNIKALALEKPELIVKYSRGLQVLASFVKPPLRDKVLRLLIIGPTNIGKTHQIWNHFPDSALSMIGNNGLWFPDYSDQETVILDEFKGQIPLRTLQNLCDRYPLFVETKGGQVHARYSVIFVTANTPPTEWYLNQNGYRTAELDALYRRFDHSKDPHSYTITIDDTIIAPITHETSTKTLEDMRKEVAYEFRLWYNNVYIPMLHPTKEPLGMIDV